MRTRWLAAFLLLTSACGRDEDPEPACVDDAPVFCDLVVGSVGQCPSLEDICEGVCGGSFECCFCADGYWGTEITDCSCEGEDAGVDAPP